VGEPEELEELEDRELEEPERLEAEEELEPLEDPELEPELLLELELLLPEDALRRLRAFSRPLSLSAPSLVPVFSFPRSLVLSSERSFLLVGEGAMLTNTTNTASVSVINPPFVAA